MRIILNRFFILVFLTTLIIATATVFNPSSPLAKADPVGITTTYLQKRWLDHFTFTGNFDEVETGYFRDAGLNITTAPPDYSNDSASNINYPTTNIWLIVIIALLGGISLFIAAAFFIVYSFNKKLKKEINERKDTTIALEESQRKIAGYSRQIEQFSIATTSVLSVRDEKLIGQKISQTIVDHSDYQRVIISLFTDKAPFREVIGFAGVSAEIIEKIKTVELPKTWYDKVFDQGIALGLLSYYIPHTLKYILNQEATVFGEGEIPDENNSWHPEDNLFVRMNDDKGNFIGVISVDDSKSGLKPTDELVRPLEIFSSLISQILVLKREHETRVQLEEQLRQAQKMEAIGNLTGGIAHDFNNILGIIIGSAELAMLDLPYQDESRQSFEEIKAAGIRARNIVQQLLSFSRKSVREATPLLLQAILEESLTFMRSTIPASVLINRNLSTKELVIKGDPTEIYQIMINLCTNAYQAMDSGGVLSVTLDAIPANDPSLRDGEYSETGTFARITISDTGQGILPEYINQIFDPYFTTKKVGKGTGIGLSVVHGIIKSHKGYVTVTSEPGIGSTFTILFPTTFEPIYEYRYDDESQSFKDKAKILFVDDEPSLLSIGKRMLERFGYEVDVYTNPLIALERFREYPGAYNLLITDYTMPGMTGDILAREIMMLSPELPVILCTGFSEKINEQQAIDIGIRKYLKKPLSLGTLARIVRDTLGQN